MPSDNIVTPGSTPAWPAAVDPGNLSEADKTAIAETAWARANGSMQAFEQFVRGAVVSGGQDLSTGRISSETGTGSNITETGISNPSLAEQQRAALTDEELARLKELEAKTDRSPEEDAELAELRAKVTG